MALYRCLSPDPAKRPTAAELRSALRGREISPNPERAPLRAGPSPVPAAISETNSSPVISSSLELIGSNGKSLKIGVPTQLTKSLVQQLGPDSEFWDAKQCLLYRNDDKQWVLSPSPGTTNETLLNGRTVTKPVVLRQGDSIAVGREAKGIVKLPLSVRGV